MHVLRPPDRDGDGARPHQPSPAEIHQWLGVRFAMLEAPRYRARTIGQTWESASSNDRVRSPEVRLSHELENNTFVDVITMRDDTDAFSLGNRLRLSLCDFYLALLGRRATSPWGDGPPPPDYFERLEADLPREPAGLITIPVDGRPVDWIYLAYPDPLTGDKLVAGGIRLETSLVMIVGAAVSVSSARMYMWPPIAPSAR